MCLQKTTGFLDNLGKSLVRMDTVSSVVERITNPDFPDCLELPLPNILHIVYFSFTLS